MTKNDLMFIQRFFIKEFNEEIDLNKLNVLLKNKNKLILRRITHLANLGNKRLTRNIIKLFYDNGILGQISVLISLGIEGLASQIIRVLHKELDVSDDLFVEILKASLKNCVYIQDIFEEKTKAKLENIWRSIRNMPDKRGIKIARKIFSIVREDDRTNNILKKVILQAYDKVF